jgi:hypothetical protein
MSYFVRNPAPKFRAPPVTCREVGCGGETFVKEGVRTCRKCGQWSFLPPGAKS